jgi:hypothetical protein
MGINQHRRAQMGLIAQVAPLDVHRMCSEVVGDMAKEWGESWMDDDQHLELAYRLCALDLRRKGIGVALQCVGDRYQLQVGRWRVLLDESAHLVEMNAAAAQQARTIITGEGALRMWLQIKRIDIARCAPVKRRLPVHPTSPRLARGRSIS